jgi:pimeloyl-ACP methyl ester carboxylesterase
MAEPRKRTTGRLRRLALGAGVAAAAAAGAVVAERAAVRKLRERPDPEIEEPLGTLPPEDLGPVPSFDGTPLRVRAAGPKGAPTLVFLHGFSLDLTTWHYQWTTLSDRFRCVLYDARAHGGSGRPTSADFSLTAMGKDLHAVLDAVVGPGPVVLIGHSMGGMAVLSFARQFPEEFGGRVVGVVLADTAASDVLREVFGGLGSRMGWALRRVEGRYRTRPDLARRLQQRIRRFGADITFLVAWATNFGPEASPSQVEYVTRLSEAAPIEVWTNTLQDIVNLDLRRAVASVTVPALVVVGDRDLLTPKTSARALRDALPRGRAVVITKAGHLAMMERHRAFNEILGPFLDEVWAEVGRRPRTLSPA